MKVRKRDHVVCVLSCAGIELFALIGEFLRFVWRRLVDHLLQVVLSGWVLGNMCVQ